MQARRSRARRPPDADPAWAWFFDIDGTLVEIAVTPSSVVIDDDLPHLIKQLSQRSGGAVSLITGRAVADVDEMLSLPGISVAGQHGLEMRSSNGEIDSPDPRADFNRIAEELARVTEKHRALIAELKGNSVALHYRRAPQLAGYAHRVMRDLQTRYGQGLVIQKGKRVVELRPEGADKGQAIRSLMQRPPFKGRMPAFVGDDVTDEHGFKVVNEMGGISVKVGKGKSDAQYRLESVSDVREWIARGLDLSTANGRRHGAA